MRPNHKAFPFLEYILDQYLLAMGQRESNTLTIWEQPIGSKSPMLQSYGMMAMTVSIIRLQQIPPCQIQIRLIRILPDSYQRVGLVLKLVTVSVQ
jgi:hypothetical protein